jgi:hypothetical protein
MAPPGRRASATTRDDCKCRSYASNTGAKTGFPPNRSVTGVGPPAKPRSTAPSTLKPPAIPRGGEIFGLGSELKSVVPGELS